MSQTPPPHLSLTHAQAHRLHCYLQTYRCHTIAAFLPSLDRNLLTRILQTLQGKLVQVMDQQEVYPQLMLTMEEVTIMKTMITTLLGLYAQKPMSTERSATLADLAALMARLKSYGEG